ncbi:MAG TPA: ATPase, T2SS/T4P/T4SS family [Opitutales bacterium]|jgi:type IV pilus assembly protein PilB|nr:ATPase, T2SS/T4P/T4SS family [Opitutales bacterium]
MALARIQAAVVNGLKTLGKLTEAQAATLLNSREDMSGELLGKLLQTEYKVTDFALLTARSRAFGLSPFQVRNFSVDELTFQKLDRDFCREHKVLPVGSVGPYFVVALANPFSSQITQKITDITKQKVSMLLALEAELMELLEDKKEQQTSVGFGDVVEALGMEGEFEEGGVAEGELEDEESAPVIQLANRIIEDAYYSGGSDIHIEPSEKSTRVRVRIDGNCHEKLTIPAKVSGALIARLKVMSNLDISEKRLPQDGRIIFKQFTRKNLDIDLRVSTSPLNHGEGVVMRILDKQKSTLPLPALGFEPENLALYRGLIQRPFGMVLHCGPTGSGKSMTLYSALNEINTPDIVIRTAEDPIEYTLPGLCQMQMHRKIGLTFASALRAFLRQDPDIILVGEIRDPETAGIAVEAALTGHMLFSTLHTNDAPSTVARLTEMGVEPFMVSAALVCVCAQRLMRRACKACKQSYEPTGRESEILQKALQWHGPIYRQNPEGCPACGRSGYKGRVGIHELMATSEGLIEAINKESETALIKRVAMLNGMSTLHQDSMKKVRAGLSTMEEAIANVPPDMEDLDAIREEFIIEAEVKAQAESARKAKVDDFKRQRLAAIKEKAEAEAATAAATAMAENSTETGG